MPTKAYQSPRHTQIVIVEQSVRLKRLAFPGLQKGGAAYRKNAFAQQRCDLVARPNPFAIENAEIGIR
jgi:hypothetical protein